MTAKVSPKLHSQFSESRQSPITSNPTISKISHTSSTTLKCIEMTSREKDQLMSDLNKFKVLYEELEVLNAKAEKSQAQAERSKAQAEKSQARLETIEKAIGISFASIFKIKVNHEIIKLANLYAPKDEFIISLNQNKGIPPSIKLMEMDPVIKFLKANPNINFCNFSSIFSEIHELPKLAEYSVELLNQGKSLNVTFENSVFTSEYTQALAIAARKTASVYKTMERPTNNSPVQATPPPLPYRAPLPNSNFVAARPMSPLSTKPVPAANQPKINADIKKLVPEDFEKVKELITKQFNSLREDPPEITPADPSLGYRFTSEVLMEYLFGNPQANLNQTIEYMFKQLKEKGVRIDQKIRILK